MDRIKLFIDELSKEESTPILTNVYSPAMPQSEVCRGNLYNYLHRIKNNNSKVMLIGEAPSYHGCRLSGIAFTSEDKFTEDIIPGIMGKDLGYNIFSEGKPEREYSASTVWPKLKDWYNAHGSVPLLWDICPFHPHKENDNESNRTPRKKEIERGIKYFLELTYIFDIQHIGCIGRKSFNTIDSMNLNVSLKYLRHPSCGGKREFEDNITEYIEKLNNNVKFKYFILNK
jgi:hypothetical protein